MHQSDYELLVVSAEKRKNHTQQKNDSTETQSGKDVASTAVHGDGEALWDVKYSRVWVENIPTKLCMVQDFLLYQFFYTPKIEPKRLRAVHLRTTCWPLDNQNPTHLYVL